MCCRLLVLAISLLLVTTPGILFGAVAWDEVADGDISSDPNAPTPVTFAVGSNTVSASVVAPSDVYDYLTFTILPGQTLTQILQMDFVDVDSGFPGNTAFHAIIVGSTSFVPDFDTIDSFLGANHMDPLPAGTDILPDLANATLGGSGFDLPLGPGVYTYHVQQVDISLTGYVLDFIIEGEEPSADFDGDGDVDGRDFLIWQRGETDDPLSPSELELWQQQYGMVDELMAITVPEPGALAMLLSIVFAGWMRSRNK